MDRLDNRVAVITGAGSGIGRSIAHALARAGTHIVVSDIQENSAQTVCDEVLALGVKAIAVTTDVSSRESVVRLADNAYAAFGAVDILVNNAGVSWRPLRTVLGASLSDWRFLFDTNVWGVIYGLDAFLPRMDRQPGEKHIVNTSSLAGIMPVAGSTPYSASKAAVTAMSESIAQELAPRGFGVTILHPATVRTNVAANSERLRAPEDRQENRSFEPFENERVKRLMSTLVEVEDVGKMVRDAIRRNQLYVHTHPIGRDVIDERREMMYGPDAFGRA